MISCDKYSLYSQDEHGSAAIWAKEGGLEGSRREARRETGRKGLFPPRTRILLSKTRTSKATIDDNGVFCVVRFIVCRDMTR